MRPIRVLSLFDGMSCGQIALRDMGIPIAAYYASEVDKFAISQTQLNFPETIQLGNVRNLEVDSILQDGEIDLLIGGSPCTQLSFAGNRAGLSTVTKEEVYTLERYLELKEQGFEFQGQSYLFWEYMRILRGLRKRNPNILFLLENVEMGKKWEAVFSQAIGIRGVHINAALVSAQNRKRIYWTNIRVRKDESCDLPLSDIPQPEDRGIVLKDILEQDVDERYYLKDEVVKKLLEHKQRHKEAGHGFGAVFHDTDGKMGAVKVDGKGVDDLVKIKANQHLLKNITDTDGKAHTFLATSHKGAWANGMTLIIQRSRGKNSGGEHEEKSPTLTSHSYEHNNYVSCDDTIRRITPTECARLQTIPEWYRWDISSTQQYKLLGNGWNVETIKHIFSFMNIK